VVPEILAVTCVTYSQIIVQSGIFFILLEQLFQLQKEIISRSKKYFLKKSSKCDLILKISSQGTQCAEGF
jgi:hypothetical protein